MAKTKPHSKKAKKGSKSSPSSLSSDPASQSIISPQTFHPFPRLPLEIRLPIWALAFPGPRILTIHAPNCTCTSTKCPMAHNLYTPNHLPTLLSVCRESRIELLKCYVLIESGYGFCLAFNSRSDAVYFAGRGHEWPHVLVGNALYKRPEYRIRKLVIDEVGLECKDYLNGSEEYMELDELVILLKRRDSLRELLAPGDPRLEEGTTRVLEPGVEVKWEHGWGNAGFQNELLRWLARARAEMRKKGPVVKVMQWELAQVGDDFCVRESCG